MRIWLRSLAIWLFMVANAGGMCVIGWFAALETGTTVFLQLGLIGVGYVCGFMVDSLWDRWCWRVAVRLHLDDVWDGLCPHREHTLDDIWDWYVQRGKPLWLNPRRKRPAVRFQEAWKRFNDCRLIPPRRRRWQDIFWK
ncbi:MAG TPA: hypothetical protein VL689_14640 [Paraburkholderia sp.]|jgi:hypothetical protein|nr:hypothetical protein [Paraburkholderia sp.]